MTTVGDLLFEYVEKPEGEDAPPVLTLTERKGFVFQSDRFKKRLAAKDVSKYKIVRAGDIAFNPYLLWAGAIAQNTITDIGIISPLYPTFRVRSGFDPRYVARLLLSKELLNLYDSIAFGSVPRRRRSSVQDFLSLPLEPQPPLQGQRRIAEILDLADMNRRRRSQFLEHLGELNSAIFSEMFQQSHEYPAVRLGELAEVASGITVGRRTSEPTRPVPYLAVANVQAGHLQLSHVKQIEATESEIRRYALMDGDLVLTEGGDPDKLGRGTVWRTQLPLCLHQNHIFRARVVGGEQVLPDYLAAYLATPKARSYFLRSAKQTTGIASINMSQLKALPVIVPPLLAQRRYNERVAQVNVQRAAVERALAADDELLASLEQRAFQSAL